MPVEMLALLASAPESFLALSYGYTLLLNKSTVDMLKVHEYPCSRLTLIP